MENEKTFAYLLEGLAQSLHLPEIGVTQDGRSTVLVISDFEVSLNCLDTGSLLIFTVIAPMPESGRDRIMAMLLEANTFLFETRGFTLAAREDTGITLQGIVSFRLLDQDNIAAYVENFVNIAEHWQGVCQEGGTEDAAAPDAGGMPDGIMNMTFLRA